MPVVYCIGTLGVGGAETQVLQTILRLDRSRFSPHLFALSEGGPLEQDLKAAGIPYRIFGYKGLHIRRFPSAIYRPLADLVRAMRHLKPGIVHSYLYWAEIWGSLAAVRAGVPLVATARRSMGHFKEKAWYYQPLENWVNRHVDLITCNSRGVMEDVLQREKNVAGKLHLIYNGVEWERFARPAVPPEQVRAALGLSSGQPVIGTIANLIPYKGHKDLIAALPGLVADHPGLVLLLIGKDSGIQSALEQYAAELGVREHVRFLGSRRDVPELLQVMDLVVLASHEEGFSNVVLESMSAGKALVLTDVGGNAEAVEGGRCGLLVPPRNPGALGAAVHRLLSNREEAGDLGRRAQERARTTFSLERMVAATEALYVKALAAKGMAR